MNSIEEKRLNNIIKYAFEHTEYYREKYNDILSGVASEQYYCKYHELPIVEKSILKSNAQSFFSDEFLIENLIIERTSGSSGNILNVFWDKSSRIRSLLSLWDERKKYGILPTSKACFFHTIYDIKIGDNKIITSPSIVYKDDNNVISFSKLDFGYNSLLKYYNSITEHKTEWIMCHPITMYLFTKFMKSNNLSPFKTLKLIELTGEVLCDKERKFIEEYHKVPVVNHYGMRECNGIAYECPYGNMHLLDRNVYMEICDDWGNPKATGEKGIIYVTNLTNHAMPIIKYKTDDSGIIYNKKCQCGKEQIFKIINGRNNDFLYLDKHTFLEGNIFFYVIEYINCYYENVISQFKVIQNDYKMFDVYLAMDNNSFCDDIKSLFIKVCENIGIHNAVWNFIIHEFLLPCDNGKYKYFISNIDENSKE